MPLTLQPLARLHVDPEIPVDVGAGPFGTRQVWIARGGRLTGDRLTGTVLPGGGDWLLIGPDGFGRLDVRGTIRTDDGAHVYISYSGVLEIGERVAEVLGGGPATEFGELHFVVQPRFETGDPRYAWLNPLVCVAEGRLLPDPAIEYDLFEVVGARS